MTPATRDRNSGELLQLKRQSELLCRTMIKEREEEEEGNGKKGGREGVRDGGGELMGLSSDTFFSPVKYCV